MRRRRTLLFLIAAVACVGAIGAILLRPREPSYNGRKLSAWVEEYWSGTGIQQYPSRTPHPEADAAVRHIGTNAIPWMLKWLDYEFSPWKTKSLNWINRRVARINSSWELRDHDLVRHACVPNAFLALGPMGTGAVDELARLANGTGPQAQSCAVLVLGGLGQPAVPVLVGVLTNEQNQARRPLLAVAARQLGRTCASDPETALPAVPVLLKLLNSSNAYTFNGASNALWKIKPGALERAGR